MPSVQSLEKNSQLDDHPDINEETKNIIVVNDFDDDPVYEFSRKLFRRKKTS